MILIANGEGAPGVETAARLLKDGAPALDAVEQGIRLVEADPNVHSVGPNSWPNILGTLQLDAAVMDGTTRRSGAVGALEGFAHPISIARAVSARLPHEILVGEGAARFAREIGAERSPPLSNLVEETWRGIVRKNGVQPDQLTSDLKLPLIDLACAAVDPETVRDTTVYLAKDSAGTIASGGSTSGWAWKYPGRIGDTPIIGAGSYADTRYGAAACTHTGEMTIRTGTARSVVLYLKVGYSLDDAVAAAVVDLAELASGQLGTVVIHALDSTGQHRVVGYKPIEPIFYWLWEPGMPAPERRSAESL